MHFCLFNPQIAGNVGTIIRTCYCFGLKEIDIIMPCGFAFDDKAFKRSAMDYKNDFIINKFINFNDFLTKRADHEVILLSTKGFNSYKKINYSEKSIIIAGSESFGVPQYIHDIVQKKVTIPMQNGRSLNLAVSVSIIASHILI